MSVGVNGGSWSIMGFSKFTGEFDHTLDDKNRLIIPSKFRQPLGERFYMLRSINAPCIWIMPEEVFESFIQKASEKIPVTDVEGQKFLRNIHATVYLCEMDKQGRVVVQQKLKEKCGIVDSNVTLVGTRDQIELWSTSTWKLQQEEDILDLTKSVYEKYAL
jgi:MraZ protein